MLRWGPWSDRKYNLDKMTLRELVAAFFMHYSIQVYLVLAVLGFSVAAATAITPWQPLAAILTVILIYPLVEYLLHRYVLHSTLLYKFPGTAKVWKRVHYDHHQNPHDLSVLFGALYTSLPSLFIIPAPFGWLVGGVSGTAAAIATAMVIYSGYEFCHCVQHLPFTPRNTWLREIKKRHLAHHFHSERGNFGITNGIWDRLLGTYYGHMRDVQRSPTVFNLGYTGSERDAFPWVAELSASEEELTQQRQRQRQSRAA